VLTQWQVITDVIYANKKCNGAGSAADGATGPG